MNPPKKRIDWEYKRILKEKIDDEILLEDKYKELSKIEFIELYEPSLWEYLCNIYSYDNNSSIKILKTSEINKIKEKIEKDEEINKLLTYPKTFLETDIEIGEHYISKIDNFETQNYLRLWYVTFKNANYLFGFNQQKSYIATIKENIYIYNDLIIIRGQSNKLPNIKDAFLIDFDLDKDKIIDITSQIDLMDIFDKLKEQDQVDITTSELTKENPISSIPAHCITFSQPLEDNDLEEFDEDDETAKLINNAENLAKSYNYCFVDTSGYKECATISIAKNNKNIRVLRKISDIALLMLRTF